MLFGGKLIGFVIWGILVVVVVVGEEKVREVDVVVNGVVDEDELEENSS